MRSGWKVFLPLSCAFAFISILSLCGIVTIATLVSAHARLFAIDKLEEANPNHFSPPSFAALAAAEFDPTNRFGRLAQHTQFLLFNFPWNMYWHSGRWL